MRLAAKVNARYVALADQEFLDDMGLSKELFPVPERVQGDDVESQLKMEKALRSLETIIVPLRDRDMADGIADIYCRAADEGRNLVVSLGGGHYDGITARLKKWNPRIPIQVGNSLYRSGPMILKIRSMAAPAFEL
jgi:pheromone shutdown protein TraB